MTKPPEGLSADAARLWTSTITAYELAEHEKALLAKACRTLDIVAELEAIVAADGAVIASPQGHRAHPALVEARQQRLAFARLLAALRIPADEAGGARTQHRGIRGIYKVGA